VLWGVVGGTSGDGDTLLGCGATSCWGLLFLGLLAAAVVVVGVVGCLRTV